MPKTSAYELTRYLAKESNVLICADATCSAISSCPLSLNVWIILSRISCAALSVNVKTSNSLGLTSPLSMIVKTFSARVLVLPEPAPAATKTFSVIGANIADSCSLLKPMIIYLLSESV